MSHIVIDTARKNKVEARFHKFIDKASTGGCWTWRGAQSRPGKGVFWLDNKVYRVELVALALDKGEAHSPIYFTRKCTTKFCINPKHLKTHNPPAPQPKTIGTRYIKLTEDKRKELIEHFKKGHGLNYISKFTGVPSSTVYYARLRYFSEQNKLSPETKAEKLYAWMCKRSIAYGPLISRRDILTSRQLENVFEYDSALAYLMNLSIIKLFPANTKRGWSYRVMQHNAFSKDVVAPTENTTSSVAVPQEQPKFLKRMARALKYIWSGDIYDC